jgi:CheY-like chemotaxis protein
MAVILCIDDCESGLAVRKLLLESQGHTVLTALSAEEGIRHFANHPVELVVSNHGLREQTGTEVAKAMKRQKPEIPFVLLSGRSFNFPVEEPLNEIVPSDPIAISRGGTVIALPSPPTREPCAEPPEEMRAVDVFVTKVDEAQQLLEIVPNLLNHQRQLRVA